MSRRWHPHRSHVLQSVSRLLWSYTTNIPMPANRYRWHQRRCVHLRLKYQELHEVLRLLLSNSPLQSRIRYLARDVQASQRVAVRPRRLLSRLGHHRSVLQHVRLVQQGTRRSESLRMRPVDAWRARRRLRHLTSFVHVAFHLSTSSTIVGLQYKHSGDDPST